ncbi:MAG: CDP-alcohol phosphatidyltransferase family protein, partial [Nevskiales bacterium]
MTANQVTSIGAALSVAGAAAYATLEPGLPGTLISLVLLQIGYIMDCVDGQVARATRSASRFGGWWDIYCDFLAQFALGLAVLYRLIAPANHMNPWALACVLLFLFGRISSVYSSTVARSWGIHQAVRPSGNGDKVRTFVVSLLDTPVLLLLICLMRDSTSLLTAYLALMGLLYS